MTGQQAEQIKSPRVSIAVWLVLWLLLIGDLARYVLPGWVGEIAGRGMREHMLQIIAFIILVLFVPRYLRREGPLVVAPDRNGLICLFVACIISLSCNTFLEIFTLARLSFLGVLFSLFWALFGQEKVRRWSPVFVFSLLLMPSWPGTLMSRLSTALQHASTVLSAALAQPFVPVSYQGNILFVKDIRLEVVPACAGLSMWTGFVFAVLLWHLVAKFNAKSLLILLAMVPPLALLLNGLRLAITAMVAYWVSEPAAFSVHSNLEFILFPIGFFLLWHVGVKLRG